MLNFNDIEKSKIDEYKTYYDYHNALGCEFNFVSAYLWSREYKLKVALFDETLIKAYMREDGSVWGYCLPSGKNVYGAVCELMKQADGTGEALTFGYLSRAERDCLERLFPDTFVFSEVYDTRDYIYRTADLAELSGKKYHAKRNHISKFYRAFENTRFTLMTTENKADALRVMALWCEENGINTVDYGEYAVIREALESMKELNMKGALLYVDDMPAAMTLGSEISSVCFDINFEKALREYDGSYAVINHEFAKMLTDYEFLNREEDMGLEGLKKAKLSYHPAIIYERFHAELK